MVSQAGRIEEGLPATGWSSTRLRELSDTLQMAGIVTSAMLKRHALELRQYAFNTAMGLLVYYMFFFMVFVGAWASVGEQASFGKTLSQVVVGLMVWVLALQTFGETANRIGSEAVQGTLEQLAMSPLGLGNVLLCRALASFFIQVVYMLVFLVLMMATTGRWLHLDLVSLVPLLMLTMGSIQGIGFAVAGLTLLYKRTGAVAGVWQFVFIALLAVPVEKLPFVPLLPLAWGNHLIRRVMMDGVSIFALPIGDLLLLLANAMAYMTAGYVAFALCERQARLRGVLGHY